MLVKFFKVRNVKSPVRAHANDAGFDLFIPEDFYIRKGDNIEKVENNLCIKFGESALIPSGLKIEIPSGYCGIICNKSGIASKKNLIVGAEVIDNGYTGEWHIDVHNVGTKDVILEKGMKIVQVLFVPVLCFDLFETNSEDELFGNKLNKNRKENGFGSSGIFS